MRFRNVLVVGALAMACSSKSSSAPTDDAGTSSGPAQLVSVTCSSAGDGSATNTGPICQCASAGAGDRTATARYNGDPCGEQASSGGLELPFLCCADPTYPGSGSCGCSHTTIHPWTCDPGTPPNLPCTCNSDGQFDTTSPSCATSASGFKSCCASTDPYGIPNGLCECSDSTTCLSGTTKVQDCSTAAAAGAPAYATSCPSGKTKVDSCSVGLVSSSSGSSSGGAGCNSGPGTCTNPIDNGTNCRNGSVCERTCATCNYGCYRNCAQDSDCAGYCDSKGNALKCNALQAGQTARVCGGLF